MSVTSINTGGIQTMSFKKVEQFNAFAGMLDTRSVFFHRQAQTEAKTHAAAHGTSHAASHDGAATASHHPKKTKNKKKRGGFADPGPWDGTHHEQDIMDRKLEVARDQADSDGSVYVPPSEFSYRDEHPDRFVDPDKPFSGLFHRDDNQMLVLAAAREQAGLMKDDKNSAPPEDPSFAAMMRKRARLGRNDWVKALPDGCNKWANQVERMRVAIDQEDFNEDGHLEGGPCEYEHRNAHVPAGQPDFATKFRLPSKGTAGRNIDRTRVQLLIETETEAKRAARNRMWAKSRRVNEAAKLYEHEKVKKRLDLMQYSSRKEPDLSNTDAYLNEKVASFQRFGGSVRSMGQAWTSSSNTSAAGASGAGGGVFTVSRPASRPLSRTTVVKSRPVSRLVTSRARGAY